MADIASAMKTFISGLSEVTDLSGKYVIAADAGGSIVGIMSAYPVSPSDYVDMGLPSGLLWAKRNVDITQEGGFAASEYQYECSFFSWGNIDGHNPTSTSSFSPYSWGSSNTGAPYSTSPGATLSASAGTSFDAARAVCGTPWRLPSSDDFAELLSNSNFINASGNVISSSTANKLISMNGIVGIRLKSKINSNIIFFPCSGYGNSSSWNVRGSLGYYWSRSLYSEDYGRSLVFDSGVVNSHLNNTRCLGLAVRPVM